jgi:monoamine oxidase
MIGSRAAAGLHSSSSSNWGRNPLTLGSVSLAKPGHLSARQLLQAPINERIFLSGEALAGKQVQSVHGAYENGRQTARRVLRVLGRLRG